MEESSSILDSALLSLDMLSAVTNARKEYQHEMRIRGVRSLAPIKRSEAASSSCSSSSSPRTKEKALIEGLERTVLYCAGGSNKMFFRRQKARAEKPYEFMSKGRRKPRLSLGQQPPLRMMMTPPTSSSLTSTRTRNSDSYSEQSQSGNEDCWTLFGGGEEDRSKTEANKFPFPLLFRSKSCQDLFGGRYPSPDHPQGGTVEDSNSNGTASSSGSGSMESPPLSPRTSFLHILRGEAQFKSEIDSMSILIQNLDVA